MTVIRPNGISGVTSITSSGDAINFYRSDGTLGPELGINVNVTSGVSTFAALNVTGVLTYEDVASVDSVGIITARSTIDAKGDISIADKIIHTGDTNTAIRFPAADTITAETSGSERLRITSAGNIGIGTVNPSNMLHIEGSSPSIRLKMSDGPRHMISPFGANLYIEADSDNTSANTNTIFQVDGSERLRITSAGNIGVGDASPSYQLDLGGGTTVARRIQLQRGSDDSTQHMRLGWTGIDVVRSSVALASAQSTFDINQVGSDGSRTVLHINSSGNLGVGYNSPVTKTHISNSYSAPTGGHDGNLVLYVSNSGSANNYAGIGLGSGNNGGSYIHFGDTDDDNVGALNYFHDSNAMAFVTNGGERMRIDSNGNMGLGINSPSSKLHVKGAADSYLTLQAGATDGNDGVLFQNSAGTQKGALVYDTDDNYLLFNVNSGERMRINNLGNVGIGVDPSGVKLHLKGNYMRIDDVNQNLGTIFIGAENGQNTIYSQTANAAGGVHPLRFVIGNSSEAMRIDSSGSVGIGELSPSSYAGSGNQLVVSNASSAAGITIRSSATNTGNLFFSDGTSGTQRAEGYIQYNHSSNALIFGTLNTERSRVNSNGYSLFKGNASSYYNSTGGYHQFQQNTNSYVTIFNNAHSTPYGLFIKYDTTPNNTGSHFIDCEDNAARRFAVRSDGNVLSYGSVSLSDEREKKNIVALDTKWDKVKSWDLKKFHYNEDADTDDLRYGVIAQQVETVCPEVLSEWEKQSAQEAILDEDGEVTTPAREQIIRKGVKEQQMMWMAIKALQEAQERIETLETQNTSQQTQIDNLITRVTALEG